MTAPVIETTAEVKTSPSSENQNQPQQAVTTAVTRSPINADERGLKLASIDDFYRFANYVVKSGLAPASYKQPEQVVVGIQYGAELGMSPMQSLQSIAVINGKATLWGDALPGLVLGSGLVESLDETVTGTGDDMVATCSAKRKGVASPIVRTFSVADAKKANLWGKAGPWTQYQKRMLAMRARAFCLRDGFADVLRGVQIREEVEDYGHSVRQEPTENYTLPTE